MESQERATQQQDELILRTLSTDPKKGFRLLFDTYYGDLCLYAAQITDSFYLSEDIVQDFFVLFWEKKYYKSIRQNLRYYLYYSVRNAALATLQKNNRIPLDTVLQEIEMVEDRSPDEDKENRINETFATMQKLSPQEREVVRNIILENKKYKEAARELHISVNTLKTYLARAMKRLRNACAMNPVILFVVNGIHHLL